MISWLILTSTIPGSDNVDKNVILLGIYPLKMYSRETDWLNNSLAKGFEYFPLNDSEVCD